MNQVRLYILFPPRLAHNLCLLNGRGSVLLSISPRRSQNSTIRSFVVGPDGLNIGRSVCVVIGLDVGDNDVLKLEVADADGRCRLGAVVERWRTPKEYGEDCIPGEQSIFA